ncbi:MAG TPA: DUF418 domain-containing protein [Thermomonospora sp.]|nr:DUF418 domain-containing protein [Thermomonospora sp.]
MSTGARVPEIDAVRGLALCGILVVNLVGITGIQVDPGPVHDLYETLLHQRFFPVFSFLFGLSAGLMLRRLDQRPQAVLLARFGFLIPFGMVHQVLQPGEVLLVYAVVGIVVLVPASYLPRAVVLAAGTVATVAALATGGGTALIPGLFLLGMAAVSYGLPSLVASGHVMTAFGVTATAAVALNLWQLARETDALAATAGVVTGAAYVTGLLVLAARWRAVGSLLEPLGRLALTNYVTATVFVLAADRVLNLGDERRLPVVLGTAAAILVLQGVASRLWLRRYRHGPLEWMWRCLTWWRAMPNRTRAAT